MITLLTAGAFGIAMMVNFPAEISPGPLSPSTAIKQALIETKPLAPPESTIGLPGPTASVAAVESFSVSPILLSSPISYLAMFAVLAAIPFLAVLLIVLSRWRLPVSPPAGCDPARHLRRSLP